jgi:hypothetical protein
MRNGSSSQSLLTVPRIVQFLCSPQNAPAARLAPCQRTPCTQSIAYSHRQRMKVRRAQHDCAAAATPWSATAFLNRYGQALAEETNDQTGNEPTMMTLSRPNQMREPRFCQPCDRTTRPFTHVGHGAVFIFDVIEWDWSGGARKAKVAGCAVLQQTENGHSMWLDNDVQLLPMAMGY